jgi:hypothetical protein
VTCNARNARGWMEKPCVFEIAPKEETIAILVVGGHNANSSFFPPTEIVHLVGNMLCKRPPNHPHKQAREFSLPKVCRKLPKVCRKKSILHLECKF